MFSRILGNTIINDLRLIEIEIHSYCNRKCGWCPNSIIDRQSTVKEMEEELKANNIDPSLAKEVKDYYYSYKETRIGQGRENAKEFLRQNKELMAEIERKVRIAKGLLKESEATEEAAQEGQGAE